MLCAARSLVNDRSTAGGLGLWQVTARGTVGTAEAQAGEGWPEGQSQGDTCIWNSWRCFLDIPLEQELPPSGQHTLVQYSRFCPYVAVR